MKNQMENDMETGMTYGLKYKDPPSTTIRRYRAPNGLCASLNYPPSGTPCGEHSCEPLQGGHTGGCQNDGPFLGTLNIGILGTILGLYGDNGKENGNDYIGVIYTLLISFWVP